MLTGITSRLLSEWMAFDLVSPIGEKRADIRMAILASILANVNRGPDTAPFTPTQFMPGFDVESEEPERQSMKSQLGIAQMFAEAGMGTITHGNNR